MYPINQLENIILQFNFLPRTGYFIFDPLSKIRITITTEC
jgi:hypothetical protein